MALCPTFRHGRGLSWKVLIVSHSNASLLQGAGRLCRRSRVAPSYSMLCRKEAYGLQSVEAQVWHSRPPTRGSTRCSTGSREGLENALGEAGENLPKRDSKASRIIVVVEAVFKHRPSYSLAPDFHCWATGLP